MFSKRTVMGVIVLALAVLIVIPVYAGNIINPTADITSFTGNCDSATVTWKSNLNFTRIRITNETTGDELVNGDDESPGSGSFTATFSPPLENGTVLSVTIDPEPGPDSVKATLIVSC